jgi:hypothetical protein
VAPRRREPRAFPIEADAAGEKISGEYVIKGGVITVYSEFGSDTTQVGTSPPESLARMLLPELYEKSKRS